MRNKKLIRTLISLLTVIMLIFAVRVTAFATDESGVVATEEVTVEPTQEYTKPVPETDAPTQAPTEPQVEETEPEVTEPQETEAPQSDERKEELPQVESQDVVEPTKMAIPDVEVSDTSLMGGVIAWLCVAVGIAVIAGVLVSQRTRQVGSGSRDNNRR